MVDYHSGMKLETFMFLNAVHYKEQLQGKGLWEHLFHAASIVLCNCLLIK